MTRPVRLLFALALVIVGPTSRAAAQRCDAPRVLLTVDKSSSMLGDLPGGGTKWAAARMAIGELASGYSDRIDFGLQIFPYPNRCQPGAIMLDVGTHTAAELLNGLGSPPPTGGNYTPMAQTLDVVGDYAPLLDGTRDNHVILVTDGWQWCDPYDASTRFTPVEAIRRLRELGITVHVIGFGAAVDSLTLNRAAVAAGTELPGCDATLDDPAAPNHCYAQANDLTELRMALDSIARLITDEMCDGFDNDCDGQVDEGFDVDADGYNICGSDRGEPDATRIDCDDAAAEVNPGAAEICDGLDNDCDGELDPGCQCLEGDMRACGSDIGACERGVQHCEGGAWGACGGGVLEGSESCNGLDDDCDGEIDDGADASCADGEVCTADGCIPLMPPQPEEPAVPSTDEDPVSLDGGCACRAASAPRQSSAGAWLALGLIGLVVWRRRSERG